MYPSLLHLIDVGQSHWAALAAQPCLTALRAGQCDARVCGQHLRAAVVIFEALGRLVEERRHPTAHALWCRDTLEALRQVAAQVPTAAESVMSVDLAAVVLVEIVRHRASISLEGLLGALHAVFHSALVGSDLTGHVVRVCGDVVASPLAQVLVVDGVADLERDAQRPIFAGRLGEQDLVDLDMAALAEASEEVFAALEDLFLALWPLRSGALDEQVHVLNPSSGAHPICHNMPEVRAALRAGHRSWRRFPYYEWRYGVRGRRFARSDSAWLVLMAQQSWPRVERQVGWLGRVLAARGMPRWLLEAHLNLLHEELTTSLPERADDFEGLELAAQHLAAERREALGEDCFWELAAEFQVAVGPAWSERLPEGGALVVGAVVDEHLGVEQAVAVTTSWLTDEARFPASWIEAVKALTARTRHALTRRQVERGRGGGVRQDER